MRMRGLLTSMGAGGSLIAAALCAAGLVGGILAFRGEPGGIAEANAGDVTVPDATPSGPAASRPAALPELLAAADSAVARGDRPVAPRRRGERRGARRPGAGSPGGAAPTPQGGTRSPESPSAGGGSGPSSPPATEAPPAADEPAVSVKRTVEQTRDAVDPVVEAAPPAVQQPVEQVADVVEDVAGTVDDALEPVTGLLKP
jgi:hypothetical protein